MTNLQKEIQDRSAAINRMGYWWMAGFLNVTADSESLLQTSMTLLMVVNEQSRTREKRINENN